MRRSRSGLVLFFCTFVGSLMGVGFADGGHQSVGKPADYYRLDLDEPSDDWCGMGRSQYTWNDADELAASEPSAVPQSTPGATGWILLLPPGSSQVAVLYVDDETACQLANEDAAATESQVYAGCDAAPAATLVDDWSSHADFVDWSQFSAESFGRLSCSLNLSEDFAAAPADDLVPAEPVSDEDALLAASASGGWLPALLVWQHMNAEASIREFVWDGCQSYPDASLAGWLDESAALASAQLWRSIGDVAWQIVEQLSERRDDLITAATRQIVEVLGWPAAADSTAESAPAADGLREWPNVSRTPGSFLAL